MSMYKSLGPAIDWITATSKESSAGYEPLYWLAKNISEEYAKQYGVLTDTWSFYGYEGFIIRNRGHVAYGERPGQGNIIQSGGLMSQRIWSDVANVADNITRFDICVDVSLKEPMTDVASVCYDYIKKSKSVVKNRKYSLVQSDTGDTLYVGSRKSAQFGRVYDKSGERGQERGLVWRYELELKGETAKKVAYKLLEHHNDPREFQASMGDMIVRSVYRWFSDRLVEPLFEANGQGIEMGMMKTETALSQKLVWIRKQVRPTVLKLAAAGYGSEVIDALGLSEIEGLL